MNNDSQEQVNVNEIFSDNDDFSEYQDEDTDGEVDDSSDSSEDELWLMMKQTKDQLKTVSATNFDCATEIDLRYKTSSVLHTYSHVPNCMGGGGFIFNFWKYFTTYFFLL